ncbi:MAG: hypothetical protein ACK2UO_22360 [Caldilineaceae bacterium]
MIVDRRTFIAKPGKVEELVEVLKSGAEHMASRPPFRVYSAMVGTGSGVVLELEFDDLNHYERWWEEWSAAPESAAVLERFDSLRAPEWKSELWRAR